ncbi:hypothetical protein MTQ13_00525 [Streptomyces sp. XM4011]|uniref:hypothetical protein n=1 Tax=Streptomyces sp. XM4011 TaxID=2929780 RepID=UPI001FF9F071|nr:hypothetical protein [Streptomyces sp. XM4011]MCK1812776.1 hypothetical protein [Streptomyces sp. XM4011]
MSSDPGNKKPKRTSVRLALPVAVLLVMGSATPASAITRGTDGCFSYSYDQGKLLQVTTTVYYSNRCGHKRVIGIDWGTMYDKITVPGNSKGSKKRPYMVSEVVDYGQP